jgi:hypothetical protein
MFSKTGYSAITLCLIALLLAGCGGGASQDIQVSPDNVQASLNEDGTGLRLVPASGELSVDGVGDVEIRLDNANSLYGLQFYVQFDPAMLQVQDADPEQDGIQIAPGTLPAPDFAVRNVVDNSRGIIDYAVIQLHPREPAQGSGVVATIRFQGVGTGASPLTFLQAKLADPDGQELPVQLLDARFEVN